MTTVDYQFIDSDEHCYEPHDCFSRHIEAKYRDQTIVLGPADDEGRRPFVRNGRRVLPNYGDGIMGPGTWKDTLSLTAKGDYWEDEKSLVFAAEHPEYTDRDARLAWMDANNVEACILNNTIPADPIFRNKDLDLVYAMLRAFNRHMEDDWGYRTQNRIFAAGNMALEDLDMAIAELDRLAKAGVKFLNFAPRPIAGRSPADPYFDPFWARVEEAGIVPMVHLGDGGGIGGGAAYAQAGRNDAAALRGTGMWGEGSHLIRVENNGHPGLTAFQSAMAHGDRPIMDFLTALILHNLFGRFPNLQLLVTEYGVGWVPFLLRLLDKSYRLSYDMEWIGGRPPDWPSEIFKRQIYITPFYDDEISEVMDLIGPDHMLLGSDFPHPEGVAEPSEFLSQVKDQPAAVVKGFMRDNAARLYGLSPSA